MSLSQTGHGALSFRDVLGYAQGSIVTGRGRRIVPPRPAAKQVRKRSGRREPAHSLFADSHGVWAWPALDRHAAARRHASVRQWMDSHAGRDMCLWLSVDMMCNVDGSSHAPASNVAEPFQSVPGVIDLDSLRSFAVCNGILMQSIAPWWHHAFVEAKRCVHALNHLARAHVWVVEGGHVSGMALKAGVLSEWRQVTLDSATVGGLQEAMARCPWASPERPELTVALGHGLVGGGRTRDLNALVLGRLDGEQPPQWLRPTAACELE